VWVGVEEPVRRVAGDRLVQDTVLADPFEIDALGQ